MPSPVSPQPTPGCPSSSPSITVNLRSSRQTPSMPTSLCKPKTMICAGSCPSTCRESRRATCPASSSVNSFRCRSRPAVWACAVQPSPSAKASMVECRCYGAPHLWLSPARRPIKAPSIQTRKEVLKPAKPVDKHPSQSDRHPWKLMTIGKLSPDFDPDRRLR